MLSRATRGSALAACALAIAVALAPHAGARAGAQARTVNPPQLFERQIGSIKRNSQVAVLLPSRLHVFYGGRLYESGGPNRRGWELELDAAPNCGGASACFIAAFFATRAQRIGLSG